MSQPALRKPLKKVYYISAVPRGNIRHLSRAARVDVYTGQLAVDWAQITREDIETFMPYYRRKNSPAMLTLLPSMAEKVLSSYIRYYVASLNHGTAIAAAPRRTGELSQAVTLENVPFLGMFSTEEVVPTETDFTQTELQRINAIVRDNAAIAARLGLTESGDNKGPKVDEAKARAAIAASPDGVYFQVGYLPMGNVPGSSSAAAAAPASSSASMPAMGSASGSSSSSSALALMPAMGSASAAAAAPAPAPAPASARGRGSSRGRGGPASRGSSTAGRKRGRGALNSIAEGENGAEQENGNNSASQPPNNGTSQGNASGSAAGTGGRRRRHRRSTKRKTRRSQKKTRTGRRRHA